ncbi:MAG: YlmC/YmxH family sporulation protein [Oscillospiraceae bacterium]
MNLYDLCERDIVSLASGVNLGKIDDICFDETNAKITHIVIFGRSKFFGLFGREADTEIPWAEIVKIGEDVVLVRGELSHSEKKPYFAFKFK